MTQATTDNSAEADLKRTILWQYDKAEHLVAVIQTFRDFFAQSTQAIWDKIAVGIGISSFDSTGTEVVPTAVDEFVLSQLGNIMGLYRPSIRSESSGTVTYTRMSAELYRKILVARWRLANSNASLAAYLTFVKYIFGNNVRMDYGTDMSLSFVWTKASSLTTAEQEQKDAIEQYGDLIFAYPAGVKSHDESSSPVLGFSLEKTTHTNVGNTYVYVTAYGVTGTDIPSGSYFIHSGTTYITDTAYEVGEDHAVQIRFNAAGSHSIPGNTFINIKNPSGNVITGLKPRTQAQAVDSKLVMVSVVVVGAAGASIPSGTRVTFHDGSDVTFTTRQGYTVGSGGTVTIQAYGDGSFIENGTVVTLTDGSGAVISGVTPVSYELSQRVTVTYLTVAVEAESAITVPVGSYVEIGDVKFYAHEQHESITGGTLTLEAEGSHNVNEGESITLYDSSGTGLSTTSCTTVHSYVGDDVCTDVLTYSDIPNGMRFVTAEGIVCHNYGSYTKSGTGVLVRVWPDDGNDIVSGTAFYIDREGEGVSNVSSMSSDISCTPKTDVKVIVYGANGTIIPTGSKFTYSDTEYTIEEECTIGSGGMVVAQFSTSGSHSIPANVEISITEGSGNRIYGIETINYAPAVIECNVTSVGVLVTGTSGTVIPSGAQVAYDGVSYATDQDYAIGDDGTVTAQFVTEHAHYLPANTALSVTNASGGTITGITSAINPKRSITDFILGNFSGSTFAWKR